MICRPAPGEARMQDNAARIAAMLPDLSRAGPQALERLADKVAAVSGCAGMAGGIRFLAALKRHHGCPPADVATEAPAPGHVYPAMPPGRRAGAA